MVHHITLGDRGFGFMKGPITSLYSFPDLFVRSVEEVQSYPVTFIKTPDDFQAINKLDTSVLMLTSYSDTDNSRSVVLLDLKSGKAQYKWTIEPPSSEEHLRILEPILFDDKSLIYSFEGASGPRRIDSLGKLIWKQDSIVTHHSTELDADGNIWLCSYEHANEASAVYKMVGRTTYYTDNFITKIDPETGLILFHKSITAILKEHGLANYILKSSDISDPIHINDIQPALHTTDYFEKGDLFISSRNLSFIMHYRPSTNEIIELIEGPFACQHDVDFYNDSTLVFYNNNSYPLWTEEGHEAPEDKGNLLNTGDFYSNIVSYNLRTGAFTVIGDDVFRENEIFTLTEGLVHFLDPDTYYVEEQNTGLLWIIKDDKVIYKNVLKSQYDGYHHMPNWNRIIN